MELKRLYFSTSSDSQTASLLPINLSLRIDKEKILNPFQKIIEIKRAMKIAFSKIIQKACLVFRRIFWMFQSGIKRKLLAVKRNISNLSYKNNLSGNLSQPHFEPINSEPKKNKRKLTKKLLISSSALFLAIVLLIGSLVYLSGKKSSSIIDDDPRLDVLGAKATTDINKDFEFPLRASDGEEVSKIKFTIETAELVDEIIVQGKKHSAVKGRTFLVLMLKIVNDYDQAIEIDTRDYVRLIVNDNENERLAADIHNDPVLIQAISTKRTRLGFFINDDDKDFSLFVGEISGDKEKLPIGFE